jgi:hypothetical protein
MKLILAPLLAAAALAFVAEPPITQFSNLTATAILGWYAWHTATKTLPQLVESFRSELETERSRQRADRDAFLHELHEERLQRHADNRAIAEAIKRLATSN